MKPSLCLLVAFLSMGVLGPVHAAQERQIPFVTQPDLGEGDENSPSSSWVRSGGASAVLVLSEFNGKNYRMTGMSTDVPHGSKQAPSSMAMLALRLHGQADGTWITSDSPCRLTIKVFKDSILVSGSSQHCTGPQAITYDGLYYREK